RQTAGKVIAKGVRAEEIISQVRGFILDHPELIPLQARKHEQFFATRETVELEKGIWTAIEEGRDNTHHVVKKAIADRVLAKDLPIHAGLTDDERVRNEEQREAVIQLTTKPGQFQALEGMAGTGKSYTLKTAHKIWSRAGFTVIGMAPSAVAAGNLQ